MMQRTFGRAEDKLRLSIPSLSHKVSDRGIARDRGHGSSGFRAVELSVVVGSLVQCAQAAVTIGPQYRPK